ncbi:MAG: glutamate--tRNA ligase [Candidatus Moranbacteria bacterium]|nr:glutamate--tRNA ligase [Candidatus Moranbacteria bacterium]
MNNKKQVRVRFAPSPTGELHIGGLKTALTNYLFAKKNDGKFILRIEDTDQSRLVEGATERVIESLMWAGIEIDEGVKIEKREIVEIGEKGSYVQSKRLDFYKKYIQQLIDEGKAYYCFCSSERLDDLRKKQQLEKLAPKYDRHCLNLSSEEVQKKIESGEKYVVRFKIPEGKVSYTDLVYGKIEVENDTLDDLILMKSDGFPTYHLAMAVDDHLMEISHVFRGAEWLPSTPKHILLYEAFGWEPPKFCHMANILNKSKKKLSKREGSVSVSDFKNQGYPKEAILNFIALLGWNPKTKQEIFSMDELIREFESADDVEKNRGFRKMNKAGGVFDLDRLAWISREHIKQMDVKDLYEQVIPFLEEKDFYQNSSLLSNFSDEQKKDYVKKVLTVEKERMEKFTEAGENNLFFFSEIGNVDKDLLRWKENSDEETKKALEKAQKVLGEISEEDWTKENLEKLLLEAAGEKRGDLLFPLRGVLTGAKKSPSPFECAWVLGKIESLRRIGRGIESFG